MANKIKTNLTIKYPKNVAFGFESTWRLTNKRLQDMYDSIHHRSDGYIDVAILKNNKRFMNAFGKLTCFSPLDNDPHNIEIPTLKLTNKNKLIDEFGKLSTLMTRSGFIESSKSHNNNLEGGGHIHIDFLGIFGDLGYNNDYKYTDHIKRYGRFYGFSDRNRLTNFNYTKFNDNKEEINHIFALFTHNMFTYVLNNPWLPWAFNAPVDNDNAKLYVANNFAQNIRDIEKEGLQLTRKLTIDRKTYAVTLRPDLGTFEFRFYSMPKTPSELSFIIDLTRAYHKHCFNLTMAGIKLKPIYSNNEYLGKLLTKIKISTCIKGLENMCKDLGMDFSKIEKFGFIDNLEMRYAYQNNDNITMLN